MVTYVSGPPYRRANLFNRRWIRSTAGLTQLRFMAKTRKQKEEALAKLTTIVDQSVGMAFLHFVGLTVEETNELRNLLREKNVGYTVPKKRLLTRALESKKLEGDLPELEGEIAIVYSSEDDLAPAREVYEFAKAHKDQLSIVGGVYDSMYRDQEFMLSIASIPSTEVLYGQFVNLINSPIARFAVVLDQIAQQKA